MTDSAWTIAVVCPRYGYQCWILPVLSREKTGASQLTYTGLSGFG